MFNLMGPKIWTRLATGMVTVLVVTGCAMVPLSERQAPGEAPVVIGPPVRENDTRLEDAFVCVANELRNNNAPQLGIAVGEVRDFTGKFSEADGGNPITQGGALMVMSALGKLGSTVRIHERYDTRIADMELAYMDRRQLGDGRTHVVGGEQGRQQVPWLPYLGGTVLQSDYYIVGGITELNYNIASGGIQAGVNAINPQARTFTVNVAVDLRIVNTESLVVKRTVSLSKQLVGYEVGLDIFRFFGSTLVDLNTGIKAQEPMQMGVRVALEQGVLDLIGALHGVDPAPCINRERSTSEHSARERERARAELRAGQGQVRTTPREAEPAPAPRRDAPPVVRREPREDERRIRDPEPAPEQAPASGEPEIYTVEFAGDSVELSAEGRAIVDEASRRVSSGSHYASLLVESQTANGDEQRALELAQKRAEVVRARLLRNGVDESRISLVWYGNGNGNGNGNVGRVLIQVFDA